MAKAEMKTESGQTNQQQSTHQTGKQTGQHSGTMQTTGSNTQKLEMARRGTNFPTVFSLGPREIFTLSPFELMRQFSEEMNRAFDNFGLSRQTDGMQRTAWSPAIDIFKKDGNLIVHAELPGLNKDEVKIEATEDGLVIRGEKKSEHEEHGEGFYR